MTDISRLAAAKTISGWMTEHLQATTRAETRDIPPFGAVAVSAEQVMRYLIQRIEKGEKE